MSGSEKTFNDLINNIPETRKNNALQKILRHNNTCKIWIGGSENDRYNYPYRLAPVDRGTERIRECSQELMIDSSINDPSITNKDVIEKATELDAQWVIPKDYWGEIDKTHDSIKEFLELYEKSNCRAKIIIPIQPPHDEHYNRYESFYSQFSHFAVGGVKDAGPEEQIEAVETFRAAVGPHKWVHGLGMGCSEKMIRALQTKDPFLDSLDVSTFETVPGQYGAIAGQDWKQEPFNYPSGDEVSTLKAIQMEYLVYQANYQLTPFANDGRQHRSEISDPNQTTLQPSDWEPEQTSNEDEAESEEPALIPQPNPP